MTIRHLKTFIKVCDLGSISKTAEELSISQPSVSQTIKELENYYNIVIFDRVGKKLSLTNDGNILLIKAKEAVASFDEFEAAANKAETSPIVKIGATMTFGTYTLPSLINDLKREIPNVEPYLYIDKIQGLEDKLISGDIDFAISEGLIKSKFIKMTTFGTDNLVVIAGIDYPIPEKIKLKDLLTYDLLVREDGSAPREVLDNALAKLGLTIVNPRMESVSNMIIISMAMNNLGVGILPYDIVKRYIFEDKVRVIELDTPLVRKLCLLTHKNKCFTTYEKKTYNLVLKILQSQKYGS